MEADTDAYWLIESLLILFYVHPGLILSVTRMYEILVYSVPEHIDNTSRTQSVDNVFRTLMGLWEY